MINLCLRTFKISESFLFLLWTVHAMQIKIKKIKAREVLDSRGNPTIEVDLSTGSCLSSSIVPSGASTGVHEALELRDNDKKRYDGKGVLKAVENTNKIIAKKIVGLDCRKQREIDNILIELDGTNKKSYLGANAILGVSMAVCKVGAICSGKQLYEHIKILSNSKRLKLPISQMNVLDGGAHVGAENDLQEYMIVPHGLKSFSENLRAGTETYHIIKKKIEKKYSYKAVSVTAEGGFIAPMEGVNERLEFLQSSIEEAGYNKKISIALDSAASEFYKNGEYQIGQKKMSAEELIDFYTGLIKMFPIISIEDGLAQDDWEGWRLLTKTLGNKISIVGDDLLVTNVERINNALQENACNALLLKVNQIGTVTESIDAANISFKNKWGVIVSHRSGDTEDSFIADLAVGLAAPQVKFGAPARSDRTAKYNRLLRIEEEIEIMN